MLINAVIIFFQEVFEAALLMSLLLATSHKQQMRFHWFALAILFGLAGATLYAWQMPNVSEMFDYVGQEVTNAVLQISISLCLALVLLSPRLLRWPMITAVAAAMSLEGSEIVIYVSGFLQQQQHSLALLTGSLIGSCIGASFGAILYYSLIRYRSIAAQRITAVLIAITSASMLSQACQQLVQADWLPGFFTVWNSSRIISEQSVVGHLLYAFFGYEATPNLTQLIGYLLPLVILLLLSGLRNAKDTAHAA